ncbi:hypothetical protein [Lysinibacter sp. HNR]|uniref:hypothetical protein n=1 Tax=Lysinibacter sp. HNR TaxID=3031408 RepID=UPI002435C3E7|nr:hypothetical protein [Lysinibacter sp. HNR]WGD36515.1 hypothetical protein FrondiHNR_08510 [Lysinibacter sp. HNR]
MGIDRVFLAMDMDVAGHRSRLETAAAIGHNFDQDRLDRVTELLADAADILVAEGVKSSLHNRVGT